MDREITELERELRKILVRVVDSYVDTRLDDFEIRMLDSDVDDIKRVFRQALPKFNRDQFNLLGCERHWADDFGKPCTCDDNIRNVELGFKQAIKATKETLK